MYIHTRVCAHNIDDKPMEHHDLASHCQPYIKHYVTTYIVANT